MRFRRTASGYAWSSSDDCERYSCDVAKYGMMGDGLVMFQAACFSSIKLP